MSMRTAGVVLVWGFLCVVAAAEVAPLPRYPAAGAVELVERAPVSVEPVGDGVCLLDFGSAAFGNVALTPPAGSAETLVVRFGELLTDGRVDREPGASIYYAEVRVAATPGERLVVEPPVNQRNTQQHTNGTPPAVLTPPEWGVVAPFRWVEVEGLGDADAAAAAAVQRAAFAKDWDDDAAAFECSDETLNRVWDLCEYAIKATTFAGVYVDGNRERIPYEADAYLNQLSHYYAEGDPGMARLTYDWLMRHSTWPTEWAPHLVFMAHADWRQTGDAEWLRPRYEALKAKTLEDRLGESGLVESSKEKIRWGDIVDWPQAERDGYRLTRVNTVVNAFHYAAVVRMAEMAAAIGADDDARRYRDHAEAFLERFNATLYDREKGLYRDGRGVDHHAHHASFFPLAFGMAPAGEGERIAARLAEGGMRCSVYGAQYYLQALFEHGAGAEAVGLITADGDRSWAHMLRRDATITWEAWDRKYKPNLDFNHAWGAAPANLLPRYVLGAHPLTPGWGEAAIEPVTCGLRYAKGRVPTPHGSIAIDWTAGEGFELRIATPDGVAAQVRVPGEAGSTVLVDGEPAAAEHANGYWRLGDKLSGEHVITVTP